MVDMLAASGGMEARLEVFGDNYSVRVGDNYQNRLTDM